MSARREWIGHDHAGGVVVSALQISLLQQGKAQTKAGVVIMRVFAEQIAKDLLSLGVVAFAHGAIAFVVSLLVSLRVDQTGKGKTKHEGGHTEGRHPQITLLVITLHDSHLTKRSLPRRGRAAAAEDARRACRRGCAAK